MRKREERERGSEGGTKRGRRRWRKGEHPVGKWQTQGSHLELSPDSVVHIPPQTPLPIICEFITTQVNHKKNVKQIRGQCSKVNFKPPTVYLLVIHSQGWGIFHRMLDLLPTLRASQWFLFHTCTHHTLGSNEKPPEEFYIYTCFVIVQLIPVHILRPLTPSYRTCIANVLP